ncbi:glycine cleavage system aminomethyltransferase GcvT [Rhodoblastus acidophilus]|uniref:aminomethyltransferase n=1 Tax=Candidatus Rhodoblastus alkanivorans TaxID=2954117 RepID=A0ABS9ZA93_9HYPH|nr:glycine cleavage system aminomethyltransferase GcvT [Candidatus Rhodoblastus alkanivorans]MCI4677258.1 glycine cleavage system aminomethyltransferase GcvT [Candidatus Rhodoblastus alkanivorans]MCI4684610.1 glycine cleavage system aminomethyltransferase GcvT [Candidatus Rhodoblastus alkanivorans]MDI4641932.1 glycine cleavage system aminomethyltransferase GcvT [Rhodoblastus acidophilus]
MTSELGQAPARTPLYNRHLALGGRMVDFAGYALPVNYSKGVLAEHLFTRQKAGLFDVSHMGQAILSGRDAARRLESLVPGDILALEPDRIRYTQFTNDEGGILDDLMVTRLAPVDADERLFLVVNAACKQADFAHLRAKLPELRLDVLEGWALLALQGPAAASVLERHIPGVSSLPFMARGEFLWRGAELAISRSGYTGEDGFEISLRGEDSRPFADVLLLEEDVEPIGLGARDSLRLEAGLCLYGHDIDTTTSPIEAGLAWSISKRRRAEGGFPGAARITNELVGDLARQRVGLALEGRAPAREGAEIANAEGVVIGRVTSGGFAPSLGRPIAMGYAPPAFALEGTVVNLIVRGKPLPARVVALPFVPNRYHRPAKA